MGDFSKFFLKLMLSLLYRPCRIVEVCKVTRILYEKAAQDNDRLGGNKNASAKYFRFFPLLYFAEA